MMYLKFNKRKKRGTNILIESTDTPFEEIIEIKESGMEKEQIVIEEDHLKEATRIVVKRTMEVLQPLLDKLAEAVVQHKKETNTEPSPGDELKKMHDAALQRLATQENKVAARMGKIQARIARTK